MILKWFAMGSHYFFLCLPLEMKENTEIANIIIRNGVPRAHGVLESDTRLGPVIYEDEQGNHLLPGSLSLSSSPLKKVAGDGAALACT